QRRPLYDVLVIHVRYDADDAAGLPLSTTGPPQTSVDRVAVGEQALCHALADDSHQFAAVPVLVRKVSAGEDWDTEHCEESRRDGPEPTSRVFFAIRGLVPLECKLGLKACALVAPGHDHSGRDALHARQLADPPSCLLEEFERRC